MQRTNKAHHRDTLRWSDALASEIASMMGEFDNQFMLLQMTIARLHQQRAHAVKARRPFVAVFQRVPLPSVHSSITSMKRGADKQLSKDDDQDDVVEVCADSSRVRCVPMCLNQPRIIVNRKSQLVSKWPRTQSWQNASASCRCLPSTLWTSLTDIVGYVVFLSEEAPPSRQCFHQPAVLPYVLS